MGKAVAKGSAKLPANVADFEQFEDGGFDQADADAYAIPFLSILQSGSPQCKRSDGAYIEGAQEGMLHETVEDKAFDAADGVECIPVWYRRAYVEWGLREKGGGYVAEHPADTHLAEQTTRDENMRDILPSGNQLVDTRYHYALVKLDGEWRPVVIGMSSSQIKRSRKWMTTMQRIKYPRSNGEGMFTPPMFSQVYTLHTVPESNEKGSWFSWSVKHQGAVEDPEVVEEAKNFLKLLKAGAVREATETLNPQGSDEDGDTEF
jgi:hypothetical protein